MIESVRVVSVGAVQDDVQEGEQVRLEQLQFHRPHSIGAVDVHNRLVAVDVWKPLQIQKPQSLNNPLQR